MKGRSAWTITRHDSGLEHVSNGSIPFDERLALRLHRERVCVQLRTSTGVYKRMQRRGGVQNQSCGVREKRIVIDVGMLMTTGENVRGEVVSW